MDVWHDRAVFQFLTTADDRDRYRDHLLQMPKPGGSAIVATFALDGPDMWRGLPVPPDGDTHARGQRVCHLPFILWGVWCPGMLRVTRTFMTPVMTSVVICLALVSHRPAIGKAQGLPGVSQPSAIPGARSGADVYQAACVTCHGPDGKGAPRSTVGFAVDLPDFTDCAFATTEADLDWQAVVHEGGRIRGLDRHMPAFGDALSKEDIARAVAHLRAFCPDPAWPRGDLNLPRAFFTEKAFPENEVLWTATAAARGARSLRNDVVYERRFGAVTQIEANVPLVFQRSGASGSVHGVGDIALALKRTIYASMATGRIAATGVEVTLPTGNEQRGLGTGAAIVEPFVTWGQLLPRNAFVQMHGGAELPTNTRNAARELYLRTSVGITTIQDRGFGRAWTPQVEVLWTRPAGGPAEWDLVPQTQITLSKLQHVMVAAGVRVPLTQRDQRSPQVLTYLLWDWFDGPFFRFWK